MSFHSVSLRYAAVSLCIVLPVFAAAKPVTKAQKEPAQACLSASEYPIRDLSFPKTDIETALKRLLAATPLTVKYAEKPTKRQIGADHVTADLATALNDFAIGAGLTWTQNECDIVIGMSAEALRDVSARLVSEDTQRSEKAIAMTSSWTVRKGQRFSDALREWGVQAGGREVYWEAQELESDIPVRLEGSFDDAVTLLIETLANQGVPIRASFYTGNGVVRILGKK